MKSQFCFVLLFLYPNLLQNNPQYEGRDNRGHMGPKAVRESLYLQPEDPGKSLLSTPKSVGKIQDISFSLFPLAPMPQLWEVHNSVGRPDSETAAFQSED